MHPKLNKVLRICSTCIVLTMVILATLLYGTRWIGLEPYTVLSPSMEPKYPTGSLIYVVDVNPKDLKVKDVITFKLTNSTTATHRIIEIVNEKGVTAYRTKGDNNNTPDGALVSSDAVIGKTVFCIPLLGYFAQYIQTKAGNIVVICFGVAFILFVVVVDILTENRGNKNKKGKGDVRDEES